MSALVSGVTIEDDVSASLLIPVVIIWNACLAARGIHSDSYVEA
jgi:hypothetical protein